MGIALRVNVVHNTLTSMLGEFMRMNSPIFLASEAGEDPQEFLDGLYKVLNDMG